MKKKTSTLRLAPTVELDVDVSFRHINVTIGAEDCKGLLQLSKLYLPQENVGGASPVEVHGDSMDEHVKPLFREKFWYFSGLQANEAYAEELNFDTLSNLLEQVIFRLELELLPCLRLWEIVSYPHPERGRKRESWACVDQIVLSQIVPALFETTQL